MRTRQQANLIEATSYAPTPEPMFEAISRYWYDPAYAAALDAETQANRDRANAEIDASFARALARRNAGGM